MSRETKKRKIVERVGGQKVLRNADRCTLRRAVGARRQTYNLCSGLSPKPLSNFGLFDDAQAQQQNQLFFKSIYVAFIEKSHYETET